MQGNHDFEIAIVGAGIAGLQAAFLCCVASGLRVAVLKARQIGLQACGRSTAKVTSQHGFEYASLIRNFCQEGAKLYAAAMKRRKRKSQRFARPWRIGRTWKRNLPLSTLKTNNRRRSYAVRPTPARLLDRAEFLSDADLPGGPTGALRFSGQYQFDPYLYLCGLARLVSDSTKYA